MHFALKPGGFKVKHSTKRHQEKRRTQKNENGKTHSDAVEHGLEDRELAAVVEFLVMVLMGWGTPGPGARRDNRDGWGVAVGMSLEE